MNILGFLAFVVALLFSVMVHEFGHFITARKFGMKVTEFFLGFGKKLWSFTRGETEFGIKAIPAGGYCRIVGMSVHEEMSVEDSPRAFYTASVPKRLIVLGAGSFLHFVLGFLAIFILLTGVGTTVTTNVVGSVAQCLTPATSTCTKSDTPSPASAAGIRPGDKVLAINGVEIKDWPSAVTKIRASAGRTLILTIERGGVQSQIRVTPAARKLDGKTVGQVGLINKLGNKRVNPISAIQQSSDISRQLFTSSISSLVKLPMKVVPLFKQTFGNEKRDPQGLVGVIGVARVSAQTASDPHLGTSEKIATFLLIVASLNIFVGIFNLLPLLPMDGGHIAVALADGVRRIWARRRGRSAPAPIDVEKLTPITIVVFVLLVALSLLLLAADIFNPVQLNL